MNCCSGCIASWQTHNNPTSIPKDTKSLSWILVKWQRCFKYVWCALLPRMTVGLVVLANVINTPAAQLSRLVSAQTKVAAPAFYFYIREHLSNDINDVLMIIIITHLAGNSRHYWGRWKCVFAQECAFPISALGWYWRRHGTGRY